MRTSGKCTVWIGLWEGFQVYIRGKFLVSMLIPEEGGNPETHRIAVPVFYVFRLFGVKINVELLDNWRRSPFFKALQDLREEEGVSPESPSVE